MVPVEHAFPPRKLDLLLHLVANLPHPVVLRGSARSGKTQLLRQFQAHAHGNWLVCYLQAGPNLTFDYLVEEALRLLRKPIDGYGGGYTEALEEQLADLERQGRCLVFVLDNAGALMPGLLQSLVRYASLQPGLKLVFALTPEDFAAKTLTDPAAFKSAQVMPLGPEQEVRGGGAMDALAQAAGRPGQTVAVPAARKSWVYALAGTAALALAIAAMRYEDDEFLGTLKDRLVEATGTGSEPAGDSAVPPPSPPAPPQPAKEPGGGDRAVPPQTVAANSEPAVPVAAEPPSAVAEPAAVPAPPQPEPAGPTVPPVASVEAPPAPPPAPGSVVPAAAPAATTEPALVPVPPSPVPGAPTAASAVPVTTPEPVTPPPPPTAAVAGAEPPKGKPNTLADLKDSTWLLQQDPKGFTLQLITVSQPARLNGFVRGFPPSDQIALYKTARPTGDLYTVVYGIYPSFGAALAAAAELPSRQGRPVPRPLKAVQQEIHSTHAREKAAESDKTDE